MSTSLTSNGYIYPNADDPVANGHNVIRQLANQIPPRIVVQAGLGTQTTNNVGEFRVTFPNQFSSGNILVNAWTTNALYIVSFTNTGGTNGVDASSFVVRIVRATDGSAVVNTSTGFKWVAMGVLRPTAP